MEEYVRRFRYIVVQVHVPHCCRQFAFYLLEIKTLQRCVILAYIVVMYISTLWTGAVLTLIYPTLVINNTWRYVSTTTVKLGKAGRLKSGCSVWLHEYFPTIVVHCMPGSVCDARLISSMFAGCSLASWKSWLMVGLCETGCTPEAPMFRGPNSSLTHHCQLFKKSGYIRIYYIMVGLQTLS
jgi:hypothetical protein